MEVWSYSVSPQLRNTLARIEELKKELLLLPLSPRLELVFRWEAILRNIHWSLSLSENSVSTQQIESVLMKTAPPRAKELKEAINYKDALDYLTNEWVASDRPITLGTIQTLHEKLLLAILEKRQLGKFRSASKTLVDPKKGDIIYEAPPVGHIERLLSSLLAHLNAWPVKENAIILAALANIQLIRILPFEDGNGRIARLLSRLILYKFGFDCKGFLCLEEQPRRELQTYHSIIQKSLSGNFTSWLEYFAQNMLFELENVVEKVRKKTPPTNVHTGFVQLSDRQKAILSLLDKPQETITNKKVQKRFRISQITAARDLGKLKTLGLLAPIGKGRSTSYRRI